MEDSKISKEQFQRTIFEREKNKEMSFGHSYERGVNFQNRTNRENITKT